MEKEHIHKLIERGTLPGSMEDHKIIETHISWIMLTEQYAFKIKRPVRYSFLDFSTLDKRKYYCHKELELNRRLAPEMYLDVLPVTARMVDGDKAGKQVVDYAVQMTRMDNRLEMDGMLEKKNVTIEDIDNLALKIADFHKKAPINKEAFNTTGFQEKYEDIQSISEYISGKLGDQWDQKISQCIQRSNTYLNSHRSYFNERAITGFRRECHGDLNATNIFLYDEPVIFDCIEFNEEYRQIDVLNDIAFLCVDLDFFGFEDLGRHFYDRYQETFDLEASDDKSRQLFHYYKSYRANVRAKVSTIGIRDHGDDGSGLQDVKTYLKLMASYCAHL